MDFQNRGAVGEYGRFEQILSQFLLKSLHIILDSRVPSLRSYSGSGEVKRSDKWFNLILGDRPAALDNLNFWRRNLMEPMIIDIMLVQDQLDSSSEVGSSSSSGLGMFKETVVERWVVQYEFFKSMSPLVSESHHKKIYQKSIILLRSLHTMMRILPAHKAFQKLLTASQTCEFDINYKVSSFNAPFSRSEVELMKKYSFTPVETQQGHLLISVTYLENLSDFSLETPASFPPEIITDYVGSPLTDPLRAFPSTYSDKKTTRTESFSMGEVKSSTASPFQRPHSWTSGIYRVQNQSPHPHSYTTSSPTEIYAHKMQNNRLLTRHNYTSSDDYQLSPPFSPSPSPSPPTYSSSGGTEMQDRLHSETSPVSIPHPIMGRSPRYLYPNFSDPSRLALPPLSPRSTRYNLSSQESPSGMKLLRKSESLRVGESSSSMTSPSPEMSRDCRDDSGRFSSLSSSSPRVGVSRTSSRLSYQDDLDDGDFSCPFIVDDVDAPDARHTLDAQRVSEFSSQTSSTSKKSQDTAVAALVHLLRTAPPLRQDSSSFSSQDNKSELKEGEFAASRFFAPQKTSDALEELRSYKEMKDLLLSKSEDVRGLIFPKSTAQGPNEEKS
ncbi:hypothetical protein LIER_20123 [Lithospermum erythrorhizon]|uniref:Autophagy-related protein 13 N-terminal domain-containing protein n=1 Tax=Lithospermum erythrorhizon TaxID=34254 RepID=A0AAV3QKB2_LITER